VDHQTQSVAEIRELVHDVLTDQSYRDGAAALHREWAAAPSPAALVPVFERLTAEHRG
jgi:UDP:flavonoid glycosyltransferase YjiC (YdhE family)